MQIILESDDFNPHPEVDCLSFIEKILSENSNIIFNFFCPPLYKGYSLEKNPYWCDKVRCLIENNNVTLNPHGLYHSQEEFKYKNYNETLEALLHAESIFNNCKLPYLKCWRGPHWGCNEFTFQALEKLNYTHIYIHENYRTLYDSGNYNFQAIYYNWSIGDKLDNLNDNILIAHSHTHAVCNNGLEEKWDNVQLLIEAHNLNFLKTNEI